MKPPRPPRIVIDARIIGTSTGTYAENLVYELSRLDALSEYIILVDADRAPDYIIPANNFRVLSVSIADYSLREQVQLAIKLFLLKPNLVHFCMPQQPVLYFGRVITTFHDLTLLSTYNSDKPWLQFHLKQLVGRLAFRVAALRSVFVIVPSDYTRMAVLARYRISASKVVRTYEAARPLPLAEQPSASRWKVPSDFLLYCGSQSDYKNIRRLILAHQRLLISFPSLELVLVGSPSEASKRNEQWVNSQGYTGITFFGFATPAQLRWFYENAVIYVFPSLSEGFGLPGVEAMAHGLPVASANSTCLPEIYGDAAVYFNAIDVEDITRVLATLYTDTVQLKEMAVRGLKRSAEFSWEKMAVQTLSYYRHATR